MLMEGEEGVRVRRAAEIFRDMVEEEVSKGGRSATNLEVLVNRLKWVLVALVPAAMIGISVIFGFKFNLNSIGSWDGWKKKETLAEEEKGLLYSLFAEETSLFPFHDEEDASRGEEDVVSNLASEDDPEEEQADCKSDDLLLQIATVEAKWNALIAADWIVVNSFYALDCKAVETLRHKKPVHCVGPLNMGSSSQLDMECSEWLDSKLARSIIYVSLGSIHNAARAQVREMADGLMKSGCYFLWSLHPDNDANHFWGMLPPGFIDECEGWGLIAAWFRQAEFLRHLAVGGFLSHCGWNAVIKSVSVGVPMLGFPLAGDQFSNCRLMVEEWKFGLGLKNAEDGKRVISAAEIDSKVKMLMEGEEGVRVRRAAERFSCVAEEEVSKGGWSATNLEVLVNRLKLI
ncbi:UDP-glycosyltransferase 86A1-like [Cryptomeria japonica]|uniref:UDP-glycosyltransferase 86A1-like n=1 Tax=Cryptomeria japonica TaxID=3369 RepID=UPI0027DA7BB6|nr:UDP-glycosyltransferase 86A1-like [Cryptomeria japonica]